MEGQYMAEPVVASELSPLDQIRFVEVEITRKIAAARAASAQTVQDARARAAYLKERARELGNRKGQIQYQEMIASARDEARTIVADAHDQAEELRRNGLSQMDGIIQEVVNIVAGIDGTGEIE
jgi:vacuolar-type H+-ATPase subunit H